MVFSSLQFIFIFIPIFFGIYYYVPNRLKNMVLLLGSLCFYFVGTIHNPEYLILFIVSIYVDFLAGLGIENNPKHKKIFLCAGILFHLVSIFIFKYLGFILGEFEKYVPNFDFTSDIVLPIGISFYTFQGISYIVDVYKGRIEAEKNLLRYAVFLSMFEQLIAGPIVTYEQVRKELRVKKLRVSWIINGIGTFIIGLGLKVLLANPIGKLWTQTSAIGFESISTPLAWLAIIAFTFQIYFDFWGYSLMAIGLGKMLGFRLPKNFNYPYLSRTMTEFWRRWHITLGSWFREYVYIPLGGNRTGKIIELGDIAISEEFYEKVEQEIEKQMLEEMKHDDDKIYWVQDDTFGNTVNIDSQHNFYWDEKGNLIIPFDKYEVAPGYMGSPEFTIDKSKLKEHIKDEYIDIIS